MTPTISKEQIETFNADGAVCLRGVIPDHWVGVLREATQDVVHDLRLELRRRRGFDARRNRRFREVP